MHGNDPSGLGGLLDPDDVFRFSSVCCDAAPAMAAIFNALGDSGDVSISAATEGMVYLTCWTHLARAIEKHAYNTEEGYPRLKQIVTVSF